MYFVKFRFASLFWVEASQVGEELIQQFMNSSLADAEHDGEHVTESESSIQFTLPSTRCYIPISGLGRVFWSAAKNPKKWKASVVLAHRKTDSGMEYQTRFLFEQFFWLEKRQVPENLLMQYDGGTPPVSGHGHRPIRAERKAKKREIRSTAAATAI
jgi:hypothetical protein